MQKLLLLSVILVSFLLPIRAARLGRVRTGYREATIGFSVFCVLYLIGLVVFYPALK
jgi:hypothetical protein